MSNLDEMLARIGNEPLPSRLAMMDEAVFAGLAQYDRSNAAKSFGIAAVVALAVGVVGAGLPGTPTAPLDTPFGVPPALAPSSLLLASK